MFAIDAKVLVANLLQKHKVLTRGALPDVGPVPSHQELQILHFTALCVHIRNRIEKISHDCSINPGALIYNALTIRLRGLSTLHIPGSSRLCFPK